MPRERRKVGQGQNLRETLDRGSPKSLRVMRGRLKEALRSEVASKPGEQKHRKEGAINIIKCVFCPVCLPPRREASPVTA